MRLSLSWACVDVNRCATVMLIFFTERHETKDKVWENVKRKTKKGDGQRFMILCALRETLEKIPPRFGRSKPSQKMLLRSCFQSPKKMCGLSATEPARSDKVVRRPIACLVVRKVRIALRTLGSFFRFEATSDPEEVNCSNETVQKLTYEKQECRN